MFEKKSLLKVEKNSPPHKEKQKNRIKDEKISEIWSILPKTEKFMETTKLQFIPFHSLQDKGWSEAWRLYVESFPQNERWKEARYADAMANDPLFTADGIWLGEELVGLVFHWDIGRFLYIEHLAIKPECRNQKLGSRVVEAMIERSGGHLLLEIEMPEDELTIRRQHFYMRKGLKPNPDYEYIHPSYSEPFEHYPLMLMSYPDPLTPEEAALMADFTREHVLKLYSDHENPALPLIRIG